MFRYLPFSVSTVLQRGCGKRTRLALRLGLGVFAFAALAAALTVPALLRPQPPPVPAADAGLPVVESAEIDVAGAAKVSANLKLERDSCPLQLDIVFKAADGRRLGQERLTVRRSSARRFPVPEGAAKAFFSLRKNSAEDRPAVILFRPACCK